MTPPRWRFSAWACFWRFATCSLSRRFGLVALALFGLLDRLRLGAAGAAALRRVGRLEVGFGRAGADPGLDRFDLGDVAGDADLGVVLGARVGLTAAVAAGALSLFGFAGALLRLALCARFGHQPLPSLLVRRVLAAPAAVLAQLNSVRRVSPRLVGLIIAPLAVFASQRHRDADISASHASPRCRTTPLQEKTPGRSARLTRRIALNGRRGFLASCSFYKSAPPVGGANREGRAPWSSYARQTSPGPDDRARCCASARRDLERTAAPRWTESRRDPPASPHGPSPPGASRCIRGRPCGPKRRAALDVCGTRSRLPSSAWLARRRAEPSRRG